MTFYWILFKFTICITPCASSVKVTERKEKVRQVWPPHALPCGHYACPDWHAHQIAFLDDRVKSYQQIYGIMDYPGRNNFQYGELKNARDDENWIPLPRSSWLPCFSKQHPSIAVDQPKSGIVLKDSPETPAIAGAFSSLARGTRLRVLILKQ